MKKKDKDLSPLWFLLILIGIPVILLINSSQADPYTPWEYWKEYSEFVITHDSEVDTVVAAYYVARERNSGKTVITFCANTRDMKTFRVREYSVDTTCIECYMPWYE